MDKGAVAYIDSDVIRLGSFLGWWGFLLRREPDERGWDECKKEHKRGCKSAHDSIHWLCLIICTVLFIVLASLCTPLLP